MKPVMITNGIKWRIFAAIMCLVGYSTLADAQNVTISPNTGKLIAAFTGYSSQDIIETGFIQGYGAMWRHNQLPLTMTVADDSELTDNGLLATHADNIKYYDVPTGTTTIKRLIAINTGSCYMTLSMPKGYKFTGYKVVVSNNLTSDVLKYDKTLFKQDENWYFCETDKSFSTEFQKQDLGTNPNSNDYTIQRTSTNMSNILYFVFKGNVSKPNQNYGAICFKSIEVTFAPDHLCL
jgi:hypothetical protein